MYRHNAGFTSIPFPTPPAACSAGRSRWQMLLASGLSLVALIFPAAIEAQVALPNYAEMGIEALLNIEVISAVKRQEPLFRSPSAIFVITQEDIRRSGASNIPDLLRMVPGLQVAQVDAYGWAISVRGFAERYANKLLVLIDGRTVYDPLFAGVHWDVQNLLLEDVERIEVVRGPGATLWGANAVNGVINILTRSSQETQGGMIAASSGSIEPARVHARYGGTLGSAATYRISGNYFRRDHSVDAAREPIADAWQAGSLGFRADWFATPKDSVLFQTGVQVRGADESLLLPVLTPPFQTLSVSRQQHRTGNALVRWTRRQRPDSEWSLQAYYDLLDFHSQALEEHLHTVDLDFQHQFRLSERHQWVWGLGYRLILEEFRGSFLIAIEEEAEQQFSAFWQDEIGLAPGRLVFIPGFKLDHAPHSGWNVQPGGRLLWTPRPAHAAWAAVSRALRYPSDLNVESRLNTLALPSADGLPRLVSVFGSKEFQPEELVAYEAGYRWAARRNLSLDVAGFFNVYDHLETTEPLLPFVETSPPPPHLVLPQRFDNLLKGETYGVEVAANWAIASRWDVSAAYSRLKILLHRDSRSQMTTAEQAEGASPGHQFHLRSHWRLPYNLEFDASLHHTSSLPSLEVPAYNRVDAQWTWNPVESASISTGGQNLLSRRHREFGNFRQVGRIGQAERNFYVKLRWHF